LKITGFTSQADRSSTLLILREDIKLQA
jgi:hypothetical protein